MAWVRLRYTGAFLLMGNAARTLPVILSSVRGGFRLGAEAAFQTSVASAATKPIRGGRNDWDRR